MPNDDVLTDEPVTEDAQTEETGTEQFVARRSNFRHQWHSLVRSWRNRYVILENPNATPIHCEYIGMEGGTIPANTRLTVKLRKPVSYSKAIKYHNMMQDDISKGRINYIEPEEELDTDGQD